MSGFQLTKKQFFDMSWLYKIHFSIWKSGFQCKKSYETYIFYLFIVFSTKKSSRKISLRVSTVTKKINKTFCLWNFTDFLLKLKIFFNIALWILFGQFIFKNWKEVIGISEYMLRICDNGVLRTHRPWSTNVSRTLFIVRICFWK